MQSLDLHIHLLALTCYRAKNTAQMKVVLVELVNIGGTKLKCKRLDILIKEAFVL